MEAELKTDLEEKMDLNKEENKENVNINNEDGSAVSKITYTNLTFDL